MKRTLALLLAALMLTACVTPALAAGPLSDTPPMPAEQEDTGRFAAFGPWGKWTEAQTAEAANWTEEDWLAYWDEYESWTSLVSSQYYDDQWAWEYEYYGYDEEEQDWDSYLRERKVELGMPYPDGINVSLNGAYLTFGGAAPVVAEGRTMVPARALLEALGARVDYAGSTVTAAWESGDTLTFSLDGAVLEYTAGDKTEQVDMGGRPYVAAGRTYIPVRAAAEAVGLDVIWNDFYEVVYLTDWAAL